MEMIQCNDCNKIFNIEENVCPFCGCPKDMSKTITIDTTQCLECNKIFNIKEQECPFCGCPRDMNKLFNTFGVIGIIGSEISSLLGLYGLPIYSTFSAISLSISLIALIKAKGRYKEHASTGIIVSILTFIIFS